MYATVVAYFTTTAQAFAIFWKLLAITHNHPHVIILNQKINTNTKSPVTNSTSTAIIFVMHVLFNQVVFFISSEQCGM